MGIFFSRWLGQSKFKEKLIKKLKYVFYEELFEERKITNERKPWELVLHQEHESWVIREIKKNLGCPKRGFNI